MKHVLYHPEFGFMETDYDEMRDRKLSQGGWKDYNDIKHLLGDVVEDPTSKDLPKKNKKIDLSLVKEELDAG